MHTEKGPRVDTVGRWPSASQGEKPQERPNLTPPWCWIYSLQNCEKISFCDFSHPVWSILLWQSNQTDTLTLFIKRKKWKQSKYSPTGKWTFFPGGPVIKNPPAKAGYMGLIPGQEDPTCHEAAKPLCHNCWNPRALKPILCNKRCHSNHHKYRKDLCSNEDLTQPKIKKQNKKLSKGNLSPCVFRFQSPKFRRQNLIHLLKHSQWPVPRGLATRIWNKCQSEIYQHVKWWFHVITTVTDNTCFSTHKSGMALWQKFYVFSPHCVFFIWFWFRSLGFPEVRRKMRIRMCVD